ncbi:hypothetical protein D3C80_97090 [compost metagenome]
MELKERLKLLGITAAQMKNKDEAALQGMHDEAVLALREQGKPLPWEGPLDGGSDGLEQGDVTGTQQADQTSLLAQIQSLTSDNAELTGTILSLQQDKTQLLARVAELEQALAEQPSAPVLPSDVDPTALLGECAESRLVAHDFSLEAPEPMVIGDRVYSKGERVKALAGELAYGSPATISWLCRQSMLKG